MQSEHTEHIGEELMTDLQFLEYKKVRDELDAAKREIETLRANQSASDSDCMTDYQFQCYKEERDEKDAMLRLEIAALKEKYAALEKEIASLRASQGGHSENGMTDYQFKAFMALLRETMENAFELGKSQEEILAILFDPMKDNTTM